MSPLFLWLLQEVCCTHSLYNNELNALGPENNKICILDLKEDFTKNYSYSHDDHFDRTFTTLINNENRIDVCYIHASYITIYWLNQPINFYNVQILKLIYQNINSLIYAIAQNYAIKSFRLIILLIIRKCKQKIMFIMIFKIVIDYRKLTWNILFS